MAYASSQPPPEGYTPYAPTPQYGNGLLGQLDPSLRASPIICTQPEPWELVKAHFPADALVLIVTDIHHTATAERCAAWKSRAETSAVFGIGGGMALDHAKFAAHTLSAPLVLCPSILSVDAGYTVAAGVRETRTADDSKLSVVYVGDSRPTALLVDFALLQSAPKILNQSGLGDLLSCATALWDWTAARDQIGERYDEGIAARTRVLLERLLAPTAATALRDVSEDGLRLLSELYVEEVTLCEVWGNSRCEEGSEHYVAYALEALTGKHYLHGQLIALCVVLVGAYQGQDVIPWIEFVKSVGLDCSLAAVGTSRDELFGVLTTMGDFVASEPQLLPGVFHFKGNVPASEANTLLDMVEAAFAPSSTEVVCQACEPEPCDDQGWAFCFRCQARRARMRKPPGITFGTSGGA